MWGPTANLKDHWLGLCPKSDTSQTRLLWNEEEEGNRSVFMASIFVDIADVLRWCFRVTGEEVTIVHGTTDF
jgi:hypothetical protein